jgi:hypothetical protein
MKRVLFVMLIVGLFGSLTVLADESAATAPRDSSAQRQARHVDDPAQAGDLPTVSKFQTPGIAPYIGCGDPTSGEPCIDDGGGGGYTAGGCNCSRICYNANDPRCFLSVANNGCTAGQPQCKSCSCW